MYPVQRFTIENIYRASSQDKQFFFKLVRVNNKLVPFRNFCNVYHVNKRLLSTNYKYHVFTVENLNSILINLLK